MEEEKMKNTFPLKECAIEIVGVLEKYHASVYIMDDVLEMVKKRVLMGTPIHYVGYEN